jgi:23S rRNA pseudouridine1911/1915/1917 synthase
MKNENKGELTVETNFNGLRLDNFLSDSFADLSRSKLQNLIKSGLITVNKKKVKSSAKLTTGDLISFNFENINDDKPEPPSQKNIKVEIIFEDEHLVVVNKPSGLITHPGIRNTDETLVHALFDKLLKNDPVRPGVVHRLDKETSGLLVLAKTQEGYDGLTIQFKDKTAKRVYWALHFGKLKEESGTWTSFLARSPKNRLRFSSQESGKQAVTHFKQIVSGPASITELSLDTGRTHQIRVHMSEANLPILNDALYGSEKNLKSLLDIKLRMKLKKINRMALVARRLSFKHPVTQEVLSFEVPWPEEFNLND